MLNVVAYNSTTFVIVPSHVQPALNQEFIALNQILETSCHSVLLSVRISMCTANFRATTFGCTSNNISTPMFG